MIPADLDLERRVVGWCAIDSDARVGYFDALWPSDFHDPVMRGLFLALRTAWRSGVLEHGIEIRNGAVVQTWSGVSEELRAELEALVESGEIGIWLPGGDRAADGRPAVDRLRRLTRLRAVLAAASMIRSGRSDELTDDLLSWMTGLVS